MLQDIRKYTQGWVATILGSLLCLAFVFWGVENYLTNFAKKAIVAKVNGKEITPAQLNTDYQRLTLRLKEQLGTLGLDSTLQQQLKMQALKNLITQTVMTQSAANAGFSIATLQTSVVIKQMPEFQVNGQFSRDKFYEIIARMGYSKDQFVTDVQEALVLNQISSGIASSAFVLPNELNTTLQLLKQRRDIEYAIITSSQFNSPASIDEKEVIKYYQQHQEQFQAPAQLRIEYVQLTLEELKKTINISEADLKAYLDTNSLSSSDPKIKAKAKEALLEEKAEQAFLTANDKLTDLTYSNPTTLNDAAQELGLKVQTSEYFTQKGGTLPITKSPKVLAVAFDSESLKTRNNSNLIEVAPGNVVVIRIKDYQPEHTKSIAAVRDQIKVKLSQELANAKAKQLGEKIIGQAVDNKSYHSALSAHHVSSIPKYNLSREDVSLDRQIVQTAFSLQQQSNLSVSGIALQNGDYAIVLLKKIQDSPLSDISMSEKQKVQKKLTEAYGKLDLDLYTENQISHSKIKIFSN